MGKGQITFGFSAQIGTAPEGRQFGSHGRGETFKKNPPNMK